MAEKSQNQGILISVAGVVAAGKTTLAEKLAQALPAKLLQEEVSGNELLEAFYRDPTQYALPLQARFLISRFSQLRADCWPKQPIVVTDYLFDKDPLFAELNLKDQELETYQGLWNFLKDRVRRPNAVIYLYAEPDFLLERINQRDRPFERGIKLQYLQSLAGIYALVGEQEAAIDQIEYLLSIPSELNVGLLRAHPYWDPLRDHPRFQALLEKYDTN